MRSRDLGELWSPAHHGTRGPGSLGPGGAGEERCHQYSGHETPRMMTQGQGLVSGAEPGSGLSLGDRELRPRLRLRARPRVPSSGLVLAARTLTKYSRFFSPLKYVGFKASLSTVLARRGFITQHKFYLRAEEEDGLLVHSQPEKLNSHCQLSCCSECKKHD